ncbi:NAD(P)H-dependent oxidoreductase [Brevibacillus fulvus]|uniref:NAD(P)H dehydrogenase (Quinone) n=1 Tax=Brevibacillus fulvus TaxID=1125967 RepID=A0A938XWT7_9BACL|nr:NAD(P)H-dependent oxidoreductase [Brevibacillus fulvus]MBM7588434.1 NAD(P)H dehydrogenase (quinone) [Brevibacillus fulvus]
MKACIVFAHPGDSSFNHEILRTVIDACQEKQIETNVRDLYKLKFSPVFDEHDMQAVERGTAAPEILTEQELITEADLLVMIYPVWWWSQPAILKGYIDRVFVDNFAFRYTQAGPVGLLSGKKAIVITTTRESDKEMEQSGMASVIKKQIADGILGFIGYDVQHKNFAAVPYVNDNSRQQMLKEVQALIGSVPVPVTS